MEIAPNASLNTRRTMHKAMPKAAKRHGSMLSEVYTFAKAAARPIESLEVAIALGITRQTARKWLNTLVDLGRLKFTSGRFGKKIYEIRRRNEGAGMLATNRVHP